MEQHITNEKDNYLFNLERKESFIADMVTNGNISESTAKSYERILSYSARVEYALNKDLSDFNLEEIEKVLFGFNANNRNTVESYSRILSSYLNWSVQKGFSTNNPLYELKPDDFVKYLTDEETYFTNRQLKRWENHLENFQDAVIIRLLFIGVGGKQLSEIRNLKIQDVDRKNKTLKLTNTLKYDEKTGLPLKFTERYLDIEDDSTFDLIEGAIRTKKYVKRNGEVSEGAEARSIGMLELVENDYVIRSSITKTDNFNYPVDKFVIYRRLSMVSDVFGIDNFTAKLIQRSGMIYYANQIMQGDILTLDDMKIVADKFNIKSYHNLKGFLTTENVKKTYGKD